MRDFNKLIPMVVGSLMVSNLAMAAGSRSELTSSLGESLHRQGMQAAVSIEKSLRPSFNAQQELELLRARLAGYAWARSNDENGKIKSEEALSNALDLTGVAELGRQIDDKIDVELEHAGHVASALTWTFGLGILRTGLQR